MKGHIFAPSSKKAVNPSTLFLEPSPIKVNLALESSEGSPSLLGGRKNNHPEIKQSSWCSLRRPLEATFKDDGIGEVLLADRHDASGETMVLKGLTSNFFAVYPGYVLRTPINTVLPGYARERVIHAAESLGCRFEEAPVSLVDVALW